MEEIALHILDVVENSIAASATLVEVKVVEDERARVVTIEIVDDGKGMDAEALAGVVDPFYTTKAGRRTGLGVPMFAQAARQAGGRLEVHSVPGGGARVSATFQHDHPDRMPVGNLPETMAVLMCSHPGVDFVCEHVQNGSVAWRVDTRSAANETT